jgi:hypothetical protein
MSGRGEARSALAVPSGAGLRRPASAPGPAGRSHAYLRSRSSSSSTLLPAVTAIETIRHPRARTRSPSSWPRRADAARLDGITHRDPGPDDPTRHRGRDDGAAMATACLGLGCPPAGAPDPGSTVTTNDQPSTAASKRRTPRERSSVDGGTGRTQGAVPGSSPMTSAGPMTNVAAPSTVRRSGGTPGLTANGPSRRAARRSARTPPRRHRVRRPRANPAARPASAPGRRRPDGGPRHCSALARARSLLPIPLDEVRPKASLAERRVIEEPSVERQRGLDATDVHRRDGVAGEGEGAVAIIGRHQDLGQQGIVVRRDEPALLDTGVDSDARAGRLVPSSQPAGHRQEVTARLGADTQLDGVASRSGTFRAAALTARRAAHRPRRGSARRRGRAP